MLGVSNIVVPACLSQLCALSAATSGGGMRVWHVATMQPIGKPTSFAAPQVPDELMLGKCAGHATEVKDT